MGFQEMKRRCVCPVELACRALPALSYRALRLKCLSLCDFIQLRNKLNQEQNAKLQQQRESLNKRNSEVAAMDKRVNELRDRLWKKKVALQQKENVPVSDVPDAETARINPCTAG